MSYTVIWFAKHKPDTTSRTAHVHGGYVVAGLLGVLIGLPLFSFWAGYTYMAPENIKQRLERQTLEFSTAQKAYQRLKEKNTHLQGQLASLEADNLREVNKRAEAEARVSMVETARVASLERMKGLEGKVSDLRAQLEIFQDILQPTNETLPVQCYNISVQEISNGIKYSLSLLKTNNKDKRPLNITLQARVLTGANVVTLNEVKVEGPDQTQDVSLKHQLTTSGKLRGGFAKRGVRVLDIRGYDKRADSKLQTHCWKVF